MRQLVKLYLLIALVILILCSSVYFIMRNSSQKIPENVTVLASENISQVETQATEKPEPEEAEKEPVAVPEETLPMNREIVINFMGDCTLGTQHGAYTERRFNQTAELVEPEYFFEGVKSILDKGTFNLSNCEGVLTDNPLEEIYKGYDPAFWFKSAAKNANVFAANGIDAVGIANNHIGDYGEQGIEDTKAALEKYGVKWGNNTTPVLLESDGIKIVVFYVETWNEVVSSGQILTQIQEYSETTDLQIVFFHGGTENIHTPDAHKVTYAHQFVDAGADLVIGSHPHVLQPIEVYNGVTIVYSLGNFVYGGHTHPENRTIVYTHTFNFVGNILKDESNEIHPCYIYTGDMNAYQPTLIDNEAHRQTVLDFMNGKVGSPL